MTWNLLALRTHIGGSASQIELLSSIEQVLAVFEYHKEMARDAFKGHAAKSLSDSDRFQFSMGWNRAVAVARVASEAHAVGLLLYTRALWDQFAQLVNMLVLHGKLSVDGCSIHAVLRELNTVPSTATSPLRDGIDALVTSDWFKYVDAFMNTTKHRRCVQHAVDYSGDTLEVSVAAFEYQRGSGPLQTFPAYRSREVLEGAIQVRNKITECGEALNTACL
jgi:hypothetical protein